VLEVNKRSAVVYVNLAYVGLAEEAGADFAKTCTNFWGDATVKDVALMRRRTVESNVEMKIAGEIKTLTDAQNMVNAGAIQMGASAGVQIAQGAQV
jgi:deoxyribose-phosphate aldolase